MITLRGDRLRHLNPDERSTAALLRRALTRGAELATDDEIASTQGISVRRAGLAGLLQEINRAGARPMLLDEDGVLLARSPMPEHPAFVLSDHREFEPEERALLASLPRVSVGPRWLHGHQCITLVHAELDQREAGWKNGYG